MNSNATVRKRCTALGAAHLASHVEKSVSPRAAALVRKRDEKVKKLDAELEADVEALVTKRELGKAFQAYTAEQENKLNSNHQQQKELNYETNQ